MRRWAVLLLLAAVGCSNAPLAGFLDSVRPARYRPEADREPADPSAPGRTAPQGGILLPPQGLDPAPSPGSFHPPDGPGPLRVPNT